MNYTKNFEIKKNYFEKIPKIQKHVSTYFSRYVIRNNAPITKMPAEWEPNMWYLGPSDETFTWAFPSIPLQTAHILTWLIIWFSISKYYDRLGDILLKGFLLVPIILYIAVIIGLTGFGFHFTTANIQAELENSAISKDPFDFWADLRVGAFFEVQKF